MLSFVNKLSLFGIAMATILAAQESICPTPCDPCHPCEPCDPCKPCETPCVDERTPFDQGYPVQGARITECVMKPGYNAPARIDVKCPWDFFITGTFLYMEAREDGLEPGVIQGTVSGAGPSADYSLRNTQHSMINMNHDYKPGFRVGAGLYSGNDDWAIRADYTRFHVEHDKRESAPENTLITPFWFQNGALGTSISSEWELKMDLLDLALSRTYYVGKSLILEPGIAIVGGWIDQTYTCDLVSLGTQFIITNPTAIKSHSKSDSWVIGPKIGLDTRWFLGSGFRLAGSAGVSLFYQSFEIESKAQSVSDVPNFYLNAKDDEVTAINPAVDIMLGFGWGSYFCSDKYHFDLFAGYDFSVFFNQNKMRYVKDATVQETDGSAGNLFLHGLVVTATFDF